MTEFDLQHANLFHGGPTATDYRGRNAEAALYPPADVGPCDDTAETPTVPQNRAQGRE
jgi:hypothetical protein